jgi:uncharacterized protein YceK
MKAIAMVLSMLVCLAAAGCGVLMDAAHTTALNQSVGYAVEMQAASDANQLTLDQYKTVCRTEANQWSYFLNATQGK